MKNTTNSQFDAMTEEQQEAFFNAVTESTASGKKKISNDVHLSTNGIDISALPIKIIDIKPKSLDEYRAEIRATVEKVKENAKKGVAVFTDT